MYRRQLVLIGVLALCCAHPLESSPVDDIHSVDFRNFSYPEIPGDWNTPIRLVNGHHEIVFGKNGPVDKPGNVDAGLQSVQYGYWGTGQEEVAVVMLWISGGGSGVWQEIFVYNKRKDALNLLWSFAGGDRADGGVRSVYFERSNLVVEVYEQGPDDPLCCASRFTRRFLARNGKKIRELAAQSGIRVPKR